jgi:ABC-2 type transport system permease protein
MFVNRILRLMKRELEIVWSDWRLVTIVFVMPVLYTVLLGYLYLPKVVTEVPTLIVDQDNSTLSRSIATAAESSQTFRIVGYAGSVDEFRQAVLRRRAYAAIWIPNDFERDIKKGRPVKLLALVDGSNMLISNNILKGMTRLGGTYAAGVEMKKLNMRGTPAEHALGTAMPLSAETRIWYNPSFNYTVFILIGLIAAVVQQIGLIGCALAYAKERNHGLVPTVYRITTSPLEVLASKALLYSAINTTTALAAYTVGIKLFGIHLGGSLALVVLLILVFTFTVVALGICVSTLCRDETFATEILMLLSLPSFLLSGFTWPDFAMIPVIKVLNWILPLTHFVMPLRTVFMQGGGFADVRGDLFWMWSLAAISYAIAYVVIWRTMEASKKPAPDAGVRMAVGLN